jgi:hypothetical protein
MFARRFQLAVCAIHMPEDLIICRSPGISPNEGIVLRYNIPAPAIFAPPPPPPTVSSWRGKDDSHCSNIAGLQHIQTFGDRDAAEVWNHRIGRVLSYIPSRRNWDSPIPLAAG